jgi:hypothetical protein
MDSYAIARAETRIRELEFEIRQLRSDVQRVERQAKSRSSFTDDFLAPLLFGAALAVPAVLIGTLIARILKVLLS